MTRTIALSEEVYKKLKRLKDSIGLGYSDLVDMLIETYHKYRVEELKKLCMELKISDREVEEVIKVTRDLRKRKWWQDLRGLLDTGVIIEILIDGILRF